jgi:hypothetical protein
MAEGFTQGARSAPSGSHGRRRDRLVPDQRTVMRREPGPTERDGAAKISAA